MSLIATGFIDPKDYPFKKIIDEQAHLDTDELRHTIKSVNHHIETDFKGQENLFCDKSQLDANGQWRRPKIMIQAEQRGFKNPIDMMDADKKSEENTKSAIITAQVTQLTAQATQITALQTQLSQLATQFQAYITAVHGST